MRVRLRICARCDRYPQIETPIAATPPNPGQCAVPVKPGPAHVSVTAAGVTNRDVYDNAGNLDCVTSGSWAAATCPAPGDPNLLTDYIYDYKNRLANLRTYNGSGSLTDSTDYVNDPLDRVASETETHGIGGSPTTTTTTFQYLGDSNAVSKETLTGSGATVKTYLFDAFGQRLTITDSTAATRLSYLYDPHGNVSGLLDQNSTLKQNYGYNAYGGTNAAISKTASGFSNKTNPYIYSGQRWDSGSNTFDMGARRYSSGTGRWLQQDIYYNALDNLGLASDPLGGNRYLFTGANPINFVELDGHRPVAEQGEVAVWQPSVDGPVLVTSGDGGTQTADAFLAKIPRFDCGLHPDCGSFEGVVEEEAAIADAKAAAGRAVADEERYNFYKPGSFRARLRGITGKTKAEAKGLDAHHLIPQEFKRSIWESTGGRINVDDPRFGTWVRSDLHSEVHGAGNYNGVWRRFLRDLYRKGGSAPDGSIPEGEAEAAIRNFAQKQAQLRGWVTHFKP